MGMNRREFLGSAAVAAGVGVAGQAIAAAEGASIPLRAFGKSGMMVSSLGFGSGSRFLMYEHEDKAVEALSKAIALGITYIDTAHAYGDGKSEQWIGRLLPEVRAKVTVATKLSARTADDAKRQIELSLKRLRTDRLDVLHIHDLKGEEDLAKIEAKAGVLEALYRAREEKVARCIGITCHASPGALALALERHDFDATQMALNAALARMATDAGGFKATPMEHGGFEERALPIAVRKGLGIIAMKVFGQDQLTDAAPVDRLLRYSLSLPVSLASCGMPKLEFVEHNARVAREFQPMSPEERRSLSGAIAGTRKAAMHEYLSHHRDT